MYDFLKQQFFKLAIYVSQLPFAHDDESSMFSNGSQYLNDTNTDGTPLAGRPYATITEI